MSEPSQNWIFLAVVWQQLLYGVAWALGGLFMRDMRRVAVHWVLFCALSASALALMLERPWLPPWLGIGGADLMILASAAAVRRGAETFFGLRPLDHEHLLVVAAFGALLAVVGVEAASNPWRVPALTLLLGLMLLRTVTRVHRPMHQEFGRRVAWAVHTPALLAATVCLVRSAWVLGQPLERMNIDGQLQQAPLVALAMLLALAGVHLAFAGMLLARLSRQLVQLSRHDALTGLLNRRAASEALTLAWQRARRDGQALMLLMLDVDHFKRVNATAMPPATPPWPCWPRCCARPCARPTWRHAGVARSSWWACRPRRPPRPWRWPSGCAATCAAAACARRRAPST